MTSGDAVREAFEAWVRSDRPHWSLRRFDKTQAEDWLRDSYRSPSVQAAWESWQAAHRAGRREAFGESVGECETAAAECGHRMEESGVRRCIRKIRALAAKEEA